MTFNQDGIEVNAAEENLKVMTAHMESKAIEFAEALAAECEAKNEVFNNLGYKANVGGVVYQVGMALYTLRTDGNVIVPVQIGYLHHA